MAVAPMFMVQAYSFADSGVKQQLIFTVAGNNRFMRANVGDFGTTGAYLIGETFRVQRCL